MKLNLEISKFSVKKVYIFVLEIFHFSYSSTGGRFLFGM